MVRIGNPFEVGGSSFAARVVYIPAPDPDPMATHSVRPEPCHEMDALEVGARMKDAHW